MAITYLKDLIDGSEERWGNPEENRGTVVPFGIAGVDQRLMGVPVQRGGGFGIQGQPGSRKTTLVANVIVNQCLSRQLPSGYHICIDTLESGMTIERYADILLAMVATKYLVYWHWNDTKERDITKLLKMGLPPEFKIEHIIKHTGSHVGGRFVQEAVLRPEFFHYSDRTSRQFEAINMAQAVVRNWPVIICGVSEHPDIDVAHKRTTNVTDLNASYERWKVLYEKINMRQLVVDHLQEYNNSASDYDKMKQVVSAVAAWQKGARGVSWIVSQIGVTAAREARQSAGVKAHAQGGQVLEAESQLMWQVDYREEDPYYIKLRRPIKSRIGIHPTMAIPIEPNSGAFIGRAQEYTLLGKAR